MNKSLKKTVGKFQSYTTSFISMETALYGVTGTYLMEEAYADLRNSKNPTF